MWCPQDMRSNPENLARYCRDQLVLALIHGKHLVFEWITGHAGGRSAVETLATCLGRCQRLRKYV
jgi:hypothetical protein